MQGKRTVVRGAEFSLAAARAIAELLRVEASPGGMASLALAGGTTPRAVYETLAGQDSIPWERIEIFFGDERCVPPDDPESNFRMAKEALLDRVGVLPGNVHRPRAESADRDAAARDYEKELPASLDVLVLGIGEDGHTASLFPSSAALAEGTRRYVAVMGPKPPPERLTLTPIAIAAARDVVMLAKGRGKAEAVKRALEGDFDPRETPASLVRHAFWILDEEAASLLS